MNQSDLLANESIILYHMPTYALEKNCKILSNDALTNLAIWWTNNFINNLDVLTSLIAVGGMELSQTKSLTVHSFAYC